MFRGALIVVVITCLCAHATVAYAHVVSADEIAELDLVLTPFGYYPRECVHGVPSGAHIDSLSSETHLHLHHSGESAPISRSVRRCPRPHHVRHSGNGNLPHSQSVRSAAPRVHSEAIRDYPVQDGDGWQVYTKQQFQGNITAFLANFTVPGTPNEVATLFLFPGIQNIDWVPPNPGPVQPFYIIQPVLQWGSSSAGGGNQWNYASWYVTVTSDVVYSDLVQTNANANIFGNMTATGPDTWYIDAIDTATGVSSHISLSRPRLSSAPWAYVTLEVYDVDDCFEYPPQGSQSKFSGIKIQVDGKDVTPSWEIGKAGQNPPACGATIDVVDPTHINITPQS